MRCECLKCEHHEARCLNLDGQLSLISEPPIQLVEYQGRKLCEQCLPKPAALPADYRHYSKREAKRLAKQETLFLFM